MKYCFTITRTISTYIILLLLLPHLSQSQSVSVWLTSGDKSNLFKAQQTLSFGKSTSAANLITIDTSVQYQTMDGFGYCLTEGSCEVIASLPESAQNSLLQDFFNPTSGLGISVLRISIGASDLSSSSYSYNENNNDINMNNFSLSGPDQVYLIPMLKKILVINPQIKILATPWSAPKWMKTSNSWIGGSLKTELHGAYATYFVKYLQAMKAQGINIWAITPQNEPINEDNEPSMGMSSSQQLNFIDKYLGPAMKQANLLSTKIIGYDHNCDNASFAIEVCTSAYVDGSAFHLYAGDISTLSDVHEATGKNAYFTEQFISGNNFGGDLDWHMKRVELGAVLNWSKVVLEWNLASYSDFTPHTQKGCTNCQGAITVNNGNITKNLAYYLIGHMSKVIKPGAVRIDSDNYENAAAFKNVDGSIGLVIYNSGDARAISIKLGNKNLNYTIPANTVASFLWTEATSPNAVFDSENYMPEVLVYPNPTNNDLNIKGDFNASNQIRVDVLTSVGEVVQSENFTNVAAGSNMGIKMKELPAGIYFLKIHVDEKICFRKIIKN